MLRSAFSSMEFSTEVSEEDPTLTTTRRAWGSCEGSVMGDRRFFPRFSVLSCMADLAASCSTAATSIFSVVIFSLMLGEILSTLILVAAARLVH